VAQKEQIWASSTAWASAWADGATALEAEAASSSEEPLDELLDMA
jgi:hypothetical protein